MKGSTVSKSPATVAVIATPLPPGTGWVSVTTVPGGNAQSVGNEPSWGTDTGDRVFMHDGVGAAEPGDSAASLLSLPHEDMSVRPSVTRTSPATRGARLTVTGRTSRTACA